MVHFVGAGPGDPELITLKGAKLLKEADIVIYAGSLVNPELLTMTKDVCTIYNSAHMTLESVVKVMKEAQETGKELVRLHTGDPCLYGAIREQMDALDRLGIPYDDTPGVSSFCAAAASLSLEYTLPGISQSVVITRMEGRTPVPERESISSFASHGATMVIFLSAGMLGELSRRLMEGGFAGNTPAAIVYRASWSDEEKVICTVESLERCARERGIAKTALIIVGEVLAAGAYERSKLYDPSFATGFRPAVTDPQP